MKFKLGLLTICIALVFQGCKKDQSFDQFNKNNDQEKLLSRDALNQVIGELIRKNNEIAWSDLSDMELASAFVMSDKVITVAWDRNAAGEKEQEAILELIENLEPDAGLKGEKRYLIVEEDLSLLHVEIDKVETLLGLRHLEEVVALDVYYNPFTQKQIDEAMREYNTFLINDKNSRVDGQRSNDDFWAVDQDVSANHEYGAAWDAGLNGDNVTVAVIDVGILQNDGGFGQNGDYNGDNLYPRTLTRKGYFKNSWWNPWASYDGPWSNENAFIEGAAFGGHGTGMLNIIGQPIPGVTGLAYNSNLVSVRASQSVAIDLSPNIYPNIMGVKRAFNYLEDNNQVDIVSMSMGTLWTWTTIKRAVQDCHDEGKMIFTAGGTFPVGILAELILFGSIGDFTLFPARMNEVHSCTGITYELSAPFWCLNCFGQADFVVEFDGINGSSSNATANTAGMAALIWSTDLSQSREDVYQKMRAASDSYYKSGVFGHGRVNMQDFVTNEGL